MSQHAVDDHEMNDHDVWSNLRNTIMVLVGVMFFLIFMANYIA